MIWLNKWIAQLLPLIPKAVAGIFARQYISGETLDQAVNVIKDLNTQGINATLDVLGEDPSKKRECFEAVNVYKRSISAISAQKLNCGISIKPSHMGLKIDTEFCRENLSQILDHARKNGIFVRIDMEDEALKKRTVDLFFSLKKEYENVGIVIQAYLRSAIDDINQMIEKNANVRLCKGAYFPEDKKVVYKNMEIINESYAYILEKLLTSRCFTGIATHDEKLIFQSLKIIDKLNLLKTDYEFQMLYGVQEDLRNIIKSQGHSVRVYVPFGKEWFAYSIRRLRENPQMVSYILNTGIKKIFTRHA